MATRHDTIGPFVRVADLPCRRALRSSSTSRLVVPTFTPSTVGSRAFEVSGLCVSSCPKMLLLRRRCQLSRVDLKHFFVLKNLTRTLLFGILIGLHTGTVIRHCSDVCHLGHSWTEMKWTVGLFQKLHLNHAMLQVCDKITNCFNSNKNFRAILNMELIVRVFKGWALFSRPIFPVQRTTSLTYYLYYLYDGHPSGACKN